MQPSRVILFIWRCATVLLYLETNLNEGFFVVGRPGVDDQTTRAIQFPGMALHCPDEGLAGTRGTRLYGHVLEFTRRMRVRGDGHDLVSALYDEVLVAW